MTNLKDMQVEILAIEIHIRIPNSKDSPNLKPDNANSYANVLF